MEENKRTYEVRVECRAFYTALVKANNGKEAVKAAEELATDASPVEFDIGGIIGTEIVRSDMKHNPEVVGYNPEPG
jgi:hypothetical protein